MSYYYLQTSNDHLAHHGILGMKWGIRRYQPYAKGSKGGKEVGEALRVRKERKNYDYKSSESYKNSSSKEKRAASNIYSNNKKLFGEWTANKIEYNVREKGRDRKKENVSAMIKQVAVGSAAIAAGSLAASAITGIAIDLNTKKKVAKASVRASNIVVESISKSKGLNTIKGKPTIGYRNYLAGKAILEKYF